MSKSKVCGLVNYSFETVPNESPFFKLSHTRLYAIKPKIEEEDISRTSASAALEFLILDNPELRNVRNIGCSVSLRQSVDALP